MLQLKIMTRPRIPAEIVIEITGQCHLACRYCTKPGARAGHVPLSAITKTLDDAAAMKAGTIRFTGGEPLLHPDLRAMLAHARRLKFYIIVNTSAEEITPAQLRTLKGSIDCALISLQGFDQRSNKAYTGSGTPFAQKLKNIFALKALLPALRLGTVITPTMSSTFPRFAALVTRIAPVSWGLFRPISTDPDIAMMGQSFYNTMILDIIRFRQKTGLNTHISNAIPLCVSGNIKAGKECLPGAASDDGHLRIVRDVRGFFKPSYFIDTPLGEDLRKAWKHPLLRKLDATDHLPAICRQCPCLSPCFGGSRAMAMIHGGSYRAADPLFNKITAAQALSCL
ncbi:MAG: radical SAM protein [Candidatus Omnitrophica bacterium]|nr:radical SAM protein [Candidatus Omnitrophota bacterium]